VPPEEAWSFAAATSGVRFSTLRDRVIAVLRSAIVLGYLEPGRLYPITWFEKRLDMSRTPIREGLLDLVSHGLVLPVRNRGYKIATLESPEIDEIFRLRELLEVPAHAHAAKTIREDEVRQLRRLFDELDRAADRADALAFVTADREFHLQIIGYGGSRWSQEFVNRLRDQVLIRGPVVASLMKMNKQHAQILSALESGNAVRTRSLAKKHLRDTKRAWMLINAKSGTAARTGSKDRRTARGGPKQP
jgi:DNA-binding GntR family transcriptional regulator